MIYQDMRIGAKVLISDKDRKTYKGHIVGLEHKYMSDRFCWVLSIKTEDGEVIERLKRVVIFLKPPGFIHGRKIWVLDSILNNTGIPILKGVYPVLFYRPDGENADRYVSLVVTNHEYLMIHDYASSPDVNLEALKKMLTDAKLNGNKYNFVDSVWDPDTED